MQGVVVGKRENSSAYQYALGANPPKMKLSVWVISLNGISREAGCQISPVFTLRQSFTGL